MPYEFGDVVLVPFPFTNQAAFKQRPAVVVSSRAYNAAKQDIVVMAITSQLRAAGSLGEVWIKRHQPRAAVKSASIGAMRDLSFARLGG